MPWLPCILHASLSYEFSGEVLLPLLDLVLTKGKKKVWCPESNFLALGGTTVGTVTELPQEGCVIKVQVIDTE
jgi:hypothetical protein